MTALLRGLLRSGWESGQAGGRGGGLQKSLIGPVPPPLRRRMADRLPPDHPPLPLHGPLRENETLSEWYRQPRAAGGQPPTALGAVADPTRLAGSGRICPLRTDHLRDVQPDRASLCHGRLLWWLLNTATLALKCRRGASTPSRWRRRHRGETPARLREDRSMRR